MFLDMGQNTSDLYMLCQGGIQKKLCILVYNQVDFLCSLVNKNIRVGH